MTSQTTSQTPEPKPPMIYAFNTNKVRIKFPCGGDDQFKAVIVTPELAEFFMDYSREAFLNRHINMDRVASFGETMSRDGWWLNGSTLVFDRNGVMVDGYTRCYACIDSGASFITDIRCGIDNGAVVSIDTGRPRTLANVLHMNRELASTALSQGTQWLWRYRLGKIVDPGRKITLSHEEAEGFLHKHEKLRESVAETARLRNKKLSPPGVLIATHYVCAISNKVRAAEFFDKLETGADLPLNSPIKALRDKLLSKDQTSRNVGSDCFMLILHCFNKYVAGEKVTVLRVPADVPRIRGFKIDAAPMD